MWPWRRREIVGHVDTLSRLGFPLPSLGLDGLQPCKRAKEVEIVPATAKAKANSQRRAGSGEMRDAAGSAVMPGARRVGMRGACVHVRGLE